MNITDAEELKKVDEPWLDFLLDRQRELVEKYKDIEGMPDVPLDINTKETQIWVKDFLWRVTEELMEAYEAYSQGHNDHFMEELSDSLHFYLEIFILIDHQPMFDDAILEDMIEDADGRVLRAEDLVVSMFNVIYHLGLTGNFLRNKKWKQTQVFVDVIKFKEELNLGFFDLIWLIITAGVKTKHGLLSLYYKKYQVNQFRQRSKY